MSENNSISAEFASFNNILSNSDSSTPSLGLGNAALGLTVALVQNATAIQNYVNKGMMPIEESIAKLSTKISEEWIAKLQQDQATMNNYLVTVQADSGDTGKEQADQSQMAIYSAQANLDNTNYNNQTTTRNSYIDSISQPMQSTNDQISNAYQMIESGPISIIMNLSKII